MFITKYKIKLSDTDAGGCLFFANQFRIVHDVYEEFAEKSGFSLQKILNDNKIIIPIVHAQSTYEKPLYLGNVIKIKMQTEEIKKHSFILKYTLVKSGLFLSEVVGSAQTVHVVLNKLTKKKQTVPHNIQKTLNLL